MKNNIIITILIICLILPTFVFAQNQILTPPETVEEGVEIGEQVTKKAIEDLPEKVKQTWKLQVLPIWQKMWDRAESFWNSFLGQKVKNLWLDIKYMITKEVEERKPGIEQEFEKEKQEMREELPKVSKSFWERFNELLK